MPKYGTWAPYSGNSSLILAFLLLIICGAFTYWGSKLNRPMEAKRPGRFAGISLAVIWFLSWLSFLTAGVTYVDTLETQVGKFMVPQSPVLPITALSGLFTFAGVAFLARRSGLKAALGSALVASIAAPMIFELPFDLIVIGRTYPPTPAVRFTLLYFLPLFVIAISSFALLTLSPLAKLSKYTLFCLAGMFLVFAVWALFGFEYPFSALPIILNGSSKVLAFAAAVTLFLPEKQNELVKKLPVHSINKAN
jgi:hypothetical protein